MTTRKRRQGNAIAEFGPALFVFFIIIFFPMLDLMGMAAIYCCGWYSNFMVTRELAVRRYDERDAVSGPDGEVNAAFMKTGIASFIGVVPPIIHEPHYNPVPPALPAPGTVPTVGCKTTITGKPFIWVPLPKNWLSVPGLNANMTFVMDSERPREVTN